MQWITTGVIGNCGKSFAPINPKSLELLKDYFTPYIVKIDYGWDWENARKIKE